MRIAPVGAPRSKQKTEMAPPRRTIHWMADNESEHLYVSPSQLTAALGIDTGNGLYAKHKISRYTIIAEYHGAVATSAMTRAFGDDTYAFGLRGGAVFHSGVELELQRGAVDTILADPSTCIAANANTIFEGDQLALLAATPPRNLSLNAYLVQAHDPLLLSSPAMRDVPSRSELRSAPLAMSLMGRPEPAASYWHPRIYVMTADDLEPNEEIFLSYGSRYGPAAAADGRGLEF